MRPSRPSLVYLLIGGLTYPILRIVYRLEWSGAEHLPRQGGYVLSANHNSNFDPWPLAIPLYPRRYFRFMAKSELFWPPLGWVIAAAGGFRVRRGERDTEAIETAADLAREGHVVVMFPEGTRRAKGLRKKHEARFRTGAARIALDAGVPLLPAAISGTDRLARIAPLKVAYGPPVDVTDLTGLDPAEAARIATERLREAISALEATLR
jgi:1-acyl-sn-glycerol-3-phosphate acyltransferase